MIVLPGRNDNDVKNRFHTKVNTYRGSRSKKRKEGGTESDGKRDKKKRKQTPSPHIAENPTDDMIPEVGMRAQVKYGGIAKGGEIVQIIKRNLFYNLVIRYDNGKCKCRSCCYPLYPEIPLIIQTILSYSLHR